MDSPIMVKVTSRLSGPAQNYSLDCWQRATEPGDHVKQALAMKTRKAKLQCAGMASELLRKRPLLGSLIGKLANTSVYQK